MNNTLSKVLIFTAGAIIGSVVTYKVVKTKCEQIANQRADEEIASVKEAFGKMREKSEKDAVTETEENEVEYVQEEKIIKTVETILKDNKYTQYSSFDNKELIDVDKPYVIPPDEYGELYDYDTIELTYYSEDGVLADSMDEPIDNIDEVVGYEALASFGRYEDDAVHVRNDRYKADYEILWDIRKYSDVVGIGPRGTED